MEIKPANDVSGADAAAGRPAGSSGEPVMGLQGLNQKYDQQTLTEVMNQVQTAGTQQPEDAGITESPSLIEVRDALSG